MAFRMGTLGGFPNPPATDFAEPTQLRRCHFAWEPWEGSQTLPRRTSLSRAQLRRCHFAWEPWEGSQPLPRRTSLSRAQLRPRVDSNSWGGETRAVWLAREVFGCPSRRRWFDPQADGAQPCWLRARSVVARRRARRDPVAPVHRRAARVARVARAPVAPGAGAPQRARVERVRAAPRARARRRARVEPARAATPSRV